ncbi:MAG: hypothetical protein SW833_02955 [Cyanobacteriota bacterium]|nr:hypothetical protein [Cyanobacteriota bacterium]
MESSGSPVPAPDPPNCGWARIIGTAIAILTLAVPTLAIARYSSSGSPDTLLPNSYSSRVLE